jgi:superfamily II DNA or RNA helicase
VDTADRRAVETVLERIPRDEWNAFLDTDDGRRFATRLETVRESLRALGQIPQGAPPKPVAETVDLLGQRLLLDHSAGPWLRAAILRAMPPGRWLKLARVYNGVRGSHAEKLHGNMKQGGPGSEVMGGYWHQGSRWAKAFCEAAGLPPVLASRRATPLPDDEEVLPVEGLPPLHDFQLEVYARLRKLLRDGTGRARFLSLPTGAGKTRVAVDAICDHLAEGPRRNLVIWIAQSHELQQQAWECFRQSWQVPPLRPGRPVRRPVALQLIRVWGGRNIDEVEIPDTPAVLVAGIDQLASWTKNHPQFFEDFPVNRLACVVIDEAHSLITQEYREVLTDLGLRAKHRWRVLQNSPPVVGMSATPWRTSEKDDSSLRSYFQRSLLTPKALGRNPIWKLQQRGVLSRVRWERLHVKGVAAMTPAQRRRYEQFRDLPADYLEQLGLEHGRNARILKRLQRLPRKSKCLVFACSVEHAEILTIALNRLCGEGSAMVVTAHTPRSERADAIYRFRSDPTLRFICNVGVLALGFDAPRASVVCVTRPTTSALRYEQMVGRGLRGPKNGGTKFCRVLDVQDEGLPENIQSYQRVLKLWEKQGKA